MARFEPRAWRAMALGPLAVLCINACSSSISIPEPVPAPTPAAVPPPPPAPAPRDPALEERVADLELRLLEAQTQTAETQARLTEARREVVRAMAKLQSIATRAEAASGMAEAEIALRALPSTLSSESLAEANQLMALATAEFEKGNYGGCLYLANETKAAATAARTYVEREEMVSGQAYERSFSVPLRLETVSRANVREGPGTAFGVNFVAPAGAALTGYSATKQWLRVTDESGRGGWISQSLIRGKL